MNEQNANQQGQGASQQAPRTPDIDAPMYALLNELDTFLGKAALTRAEHGQVNNAMQTLLRRLESDKNTVGQLTLRIQTLEADNARLKNASAAAAAVTDALAAGATATAKK